MPIGSLVILLQQGERGSRSDIVKECQDNLDSDIMKFSKGENGINKQTSLEVSIASHETTG